MQKFSIGEFKTFCEKPENISTLIIFNTNNQEKIDKSESLNMDLTFDKISVGINPNIVTLYSNFNKSFISFKHVKSIEHYAEKSLLGDIFKIICKNDQYIIVMRLD